MIDDDVPDLHDVLDFIGDIKGRRLKAWMK